MKRVNVRFEAEQGRSDIDILFAASEMDDQVTSLMDRVKDPLLSNWEKKGITSS